MLFDFSDFTRIARQTRDFILDLVFPAACLGCGREGRWLCPACLGAMPLADNRACFRCRCPVDRPGFCPACGKNGYLDGIAAGGDYEDPLLARAIKAFKYSFVAGLAEDLVPLLERAARGLPGDCRPGALVVPVPLHARRRRWRGFNQAEALARLAADRGGWRADAKGLVRTRHTRTQANLDRAARARNLAGAFLWQGKDISGQSVILVDDVATSGSTLEEGARALKQAGAARVYGLVLAK